MKQVEPQVFVVAKTITDTVGMRDALNAIGVREWKPNEHPNWWANAQSLLEFAGRMCYKSFGVGLNPNVNKVREDSSAYLANIIKSKHLSVFEHASVSICFIGVSRVFTHEIVRHRAGTAFSQESLRYVRFDDLPIVETETTKRFDSEFGRAFVKAEKNYKKMTKAMNLDGSGGEMDFDEKKKLSSALRRVAPIGLATNILVTANHRAWRHIIELRTSVHAEEELRQVVKEVGFKLKDLYPDIYGDMIETDDGSLVFTNHETDDSVFSVPVYIERTIGKYNVDKNLPSLSVPRYRVMRGDYEIYSWDMFNKQTGVKHVLGSDADMETLNREVAKLLNLTGQEYIQIVTKNLPTI